MFYGFFLVSMVKVENIMVYIGFIYILVNVSWLLFWVWVIYGGICFLFKMMLSRLFVEVLMFGIVDNI